MADEARPSFKHTVAKKALAPLVATAVTAITTYLMKKAAEIWQETVQPKLAERGGAEAVARQAADTVSTKLAPVSEAVTSKVGPEPERPSGAEKPAASDSDRSEERRKREQRRRQRRKALEQSGSS
jgi:hypothetical protein